MLVMLMIVILFVNIYYMLLTTQIRNPINILQTVDIFSVYAYLVKCVLSL